MDPSIEEKIVYSGKIFEIVTQKETINGKKIIFEIARRSPGVRLMILKQNKLLLTREFRRELNQYDYRLPGGKVFDTLKEYSEAIRSKKDMLACAIEAAKKECVQETGLMPKKMSHYQTAKAGATVEWDLFYFIIRDFEEQSQQLEDGEDITVEWKTLDEVKKLCLSNMIKEDRSVGVLLRFLDAP